MLPSQLREDFHGITSCVIDLTDWIKHMSRETIILHRSGSLNLLSLCISNVILASGHMHMHGQFSVCRDRMHSEAETRANRKAEIDHHHPKRSLCRSQPRKTPEEDGLKGQARQDFPHSIGKGIRQACMRLQATAGTSKHDAGTRSYPMVSFNLLMQALFQSACGPTAPKILHCLKGLADAVDFVRKTTGDNKSLGSISGTFCSPCQTKVAPMTSVWPFPFCG
ncbi:hypothetical protein BAUCODRAFT_322223 [Baudoinia panamericana UAMH 10762]|uniref:Uncharacterized protein n=1 Tax=Baudoinia panamericana (strain UAMH 10762) TaxID=717646 RepID=M2MJ50_BAUPA|nr:uncharacterized protein BAUCODRAFT_322223 [Baudoinia panamericana UAMH 10762]EMC91303.1 hypothetical protein BAUCODRAFT_322223 [Baudoinia panamericana UAMH 10762]